MTPEEKLDAVLTVLDKAYLKSVTPIVINDGNGTLTIHPQYEDRYKTLSELTISVGFANLNNVDAFRDVELIVEYLVERGTVKVDTSVTIPYHGDRYFITWRGRVLIENGGYSKRRTVTEAKEKVADFKNNLMIVGTWLAGIGGVLLVIIEVLKRAKWILSIEAATLTIFLFVGVLIGIIIWQVIRPYSKT